MTESVFERAERLALQATRDPSLIPEYESATREARKLDGSRSHWKGKRNKMTQCEKIVEHIQRNGSITQREAYIDYGIQSFHRRLSDLKEAGYELYGVSKQHPVTGQEYTRYFMDANKAVAEYREVA